MKSKYHIEMTRDALKGAFSEKALQTISRANIWQDRPRNQFGRDYIHFDGSAFEVGTPILPVKNKPSMIFSVQAKSDLRKRPLDKSCTPARTLQPQQLRPALA